MAIKRAWRWILTGGIVIAALLATVVGVVTNASFQTSQALGYLRQVDPQAKLGRVALGFSGGELQGLEMTVSGVKISLQNAALTYSLSSLVFDQVKVIDGVTAQGLLVDLTGMKPAEAKPAAATTAKSGTPGGSAQIAAVLIKQLDLTGKVLLAGHRSVDAKFTGMDLGAGGAGQLQGNCTFQDNSKDAAVRKIQVDAVLNAACDQRMQPQLANLTVQLTASLPGQTNAAQLAVKVTAAAPKGTGTRDFTLEIAQPNGADGKALTQLLGLNGTFDQGGESSGNFTVNSTNLQVAPFALGVKLPDFMLQGSGQFSMDAAKNGGSVKGKIVGVAGNWAGVAPQLVPLGQVQLSAGVNVSWTGQTAQAQEVQLSFGPAGGKPVATLALLKPLTVDFSQQTPRLTQGSGAEMARLTLQNLPAAWLAAASPDNCTVTGSNVSGEAVLGADAEGTLSVQTTQPLQLTGFSIAKAGAPMLTNVSLALDAGATAKDGIVKAQLRELILSSGETPLAQLEANVTAGPASAVAADGRLAVAIDQIAKQPFAKAWAATLPNRALKLDGTFAMAKTAEALQVNALQAIVAQDNGPLFTLKLTQKISVPLGAEAKLPALTGELATLEANGLPVELLAPFLPAGTVVTGQALRGKLVLAGAGDGSADFILRTEQPLTLAGLNYSKDRKLMLTDVTASLTPQGTWDAGTQAMNATAQLQVTAAAGTLLDTTVTAQTAGGNLTANVTATGGLNALGAQPLGSSWSQALPATPQNYSVQASLTKDATGLTVQSAEVRIAPPDGAGPAMAELKLLQAVTIPEADPKAAKDAPAPWPALSGDLLAVQLTGLPVGVVGLAMPEYQVRGQTISADLLLSGNGGGTYSLQARQPLTVGQLSVQKNYNTLVDSLTVGLRPVATFSQKGLVSAAVYDLAVSSGTTDLLNGRVECAFKDDGKTPVSAKFDLSANVSGLLQQPCLSAYNNLQSGLGTLSGQLAPDGTFKLDADFSQWRVNSPARAVPDLALKGVTGKIGPAAGAVQVTAPLQAKGPNGATDCQLSVTLTPNDPNNPNSGRSFNLALTGNSLVPDDLTAIANGFSAPNAGAAARPPGAPPAPTTASSGPDKQPMWGDTTGTAQVKLNRLAIAGMDLTAIAAAAQVTPTQATINNLSAQLPGGAPVMMNATLAFDAKQTSEPYNLQASLSMTNFDTGAYFRAKDPNGKIPLAGNFSIVGTTSGRGANTDDLVARVPFDFKLSSNGGTIYVLSLVGKEAGATLQGVSAVTGIAGIFGGLIGGKAPNVQQFASTVSQLTTLFDNIQYTSMTFEAQRGADRNINLKQINVQSTEIVVNGSGRITYRQGVPIPAQPLQVNVQLLAKGQTGSLLSTLGLMQSTSTDGNGFALGPQFQVGGTLQKPSYDSFYQLLIQAPMRMLHIGL